MPTETSPILSPDNASLNGMGANSTPLNHMEPAKGGIEKADDEDEPDDSHLGDGLNLWQAVLFIVSLNADYSLLAVIALVVNTGRAPTGLHFLVSITRPLLAILMSLGWAGVLLVTVICSGLVYTVVLVSRCWNIVMGRWQNERQPYGAIGYEAFGSWARTAINLVVDVTSFVTPIGILALTSENLFVLGGEALHGKFCLLLVAIAAVACPFMWLGSPRDIWQLNAGGALTASLAYLLVFIGTIIDDENTQSTQNVTVNVTVNVTTGAPSGVWHFDDTRLVHLVEICGIVQVAVGPHFFMPSLHRDMKQPKDFTKAACLSYAYVFALAVSVLVTTFIFQRDRLATVTADTTVLAVLTPGAPSTVASALLLLRNITVLVACNNPFFQSIEEKLDISSEFTWKRVALRTSVFVIQLLISETIPHFGVILTLLGGVSFPILVFLAPAMCYLRLRNIHMPEKYKESKVIWVFETVVCWLMSVMTPIMAVVILYVMGTGLFNGKTAFTVPCFINATLAHE